MTPLERVGVTFLVALLCTAMFALTRNVPGRINAWEKANGYPFGKM